MKFHVKEINCGGCASTIHRAIAQVDVAANVEVDVASKTVNVQATVPDRLIKAALESAGFHPNEVGP